MSRERERRYLAHIAESIQLIDEYVRGGRPAFFEQLQVQDAVLRRLEILADATAQLGTELKDRHPDIPWREVYGFRNIARARLPRRRSRARLGDRGRSSAGAPDRRG